MGSLSRETTAAQTRLLLALLALLVVSWIVAVVRAEPPPELREEEPDAPDGIHVLDGSYVVNAGRLHVNVTNHGLIGSHYSAFLPYSNAPSAQWPGGTGDEYLFGAGLWIGGKVNGQIAVTTGQPERELRPSDDIIDTIYESRQKRITRPVYHDDKTGHRLPDGTADDDRDGKTDEDRLNGLDDDGDGLIDEDYGQIGDQMLTCTMRDDTRLARELYSAHRPLGVRVIQRVAGWQDEAYEDIIALDFEIKNENFTELQDVYVGMYVDCDIQNRSEAATQPDDLTGYFDGAVRDEWDVFHRIQVGWMSDAHPSDPLPGVLGIVMLDHTTDFSQLSAPHIAGVRTYQRFTTGAAVYQGGEPLSDNDRYAVMSSSRNDLDARLDKSDDYRFLVSSGPFPHVLPGRTIHYRLAMVIGNGMDDMLRTALRASILQRGRWFNLDWSWDTGSGGAETKICLGDLPKLPDGTDPLFKYRARFMDEYCTGSDPVFGVPRLSKEAMFEDEDGRTCAYVNADNCEECFRAVGRECTELNGLYWTMGSYFNSLNRYLIGTGTWGREHREAWVYSGEVPPPMPHIRLVPGNRKVDIYWDDIAEFEPDYHRGVVDFESYRVWRVAGWRRPEGVASDQPPPPHLWSMVSEWDIRNFIPPGLAFNLLEQPLGQNTGLEPVVYTPVSLSDPEFAGLAEAMRQLVEDDTEGRMETLPPVYNRDGSPNPDLVPLQPWAYAPAVLDTFFAVTPRSGVPGVVPKHASRFYRYTDTGLANGFRIYHAVTARDHNLVWHDEKWQPNGFGVEIPPSNSYESSHPRFDAQTPEQRQQVGANIYVYPNPVTRESVAEFDQQFPTLLDATGSQIAFTNLPAAHSTISVFTASGDLVNTIDHDGLNNGGTALWNVMSRNGQEIVSGIYLYTVQTHDSRFDDFVGRFVIIW